MLHFQTAGESHGACLIGILEGMLQGLPVSEEVINLQLARRQKGYGRGGRMTLETDRAEILSGIENGLTTGSPIALRVINRDFKINELPAVKKPRPAHADLVGVLKYDRRDVRDILERSSARETAARVAVGAVCREFLKQFDVDILSHVTVLAGVHAKIKEHSFQEIKKLIENDPLSCTDHDASELMVKEIDKVREAKDTVGGVIQICVQGVAAGFSMQAFRKNLVFCLMSIPALKGIELLQGFSGEKTEGGELRVNIVMKPIPTLLAPLATVHIDSKEAAKATVERSDVTSVPAAGVVAEAMASFALAKHYLEKFGAGTLAQTLANFQQYEKKHT